MLYVFLYNMCLKCKKSGSKLVMLCKKAKNAEGKGGSAQFFRHPLGDFAAPWKKSCNRPWTQRQIGGKYKW